MSPEARYTEEERGEEQVAVDGGLVHPLTTSIRGSRIVFHADPVSFILRMTNYGLADALPEGSGK